MKPQEPEYKGQPDKRWWVRLLALVLGIPLLILTVMYLYWNHSSKRALERKIEEIRASGAPVSFQDLTDMWYVRDPLGVLQLKTPAQDSAAIYYQQAFQALHALPLELRKFMHSERFSQMIRQQHPADWSEEDVAKLTELLEQAVKLLALSGQAANMSHCQFRLEFWRGENWVLKHPAPLRRIHQLQRAQALLHLRQGRREQALETCRDALSISRALKDEPSTISLLVRLGSVTTSLELLRTIVECTPPSREGYAQLLRQLEQEEASLLGQWQRALEGERVFALSFFKKALKGMDVSPAFDFRDGTVGHWLLKSRVGRVLARPTIADNALTYLAHIERVIRSASRPLPEAVKEARKLDEAMDELCEQGFQRLRAWFAEMLSCSHGAALLLVANAVARCRVTEVGLALEIYKQQHGDYPDSLEALVPEFFEKVPEDPFTGAPLHYRRTEKGVLVCSVGKNMQDEGGAIPTEEERRRRLNDDVTWRLER